MFSIAKRTSLLGQSVNSGGGNFIGLDREEKTVEALTNFNLLLFIQRQQAP
jgi:hypothetical protein